MKIAKWIISLVCAGAVVSGVVMLIVWRLNQDTNEAQQPQARQNSATTVRTVEAKTGSVQAWVFAEGTVRSARREYLTFENPGRVAFVRPSEDGGELREGEQVKAGELLAHQDQRSAKADLASAEASMLEAQTREGVARAELDQARTDAALAQTTFGRFDVLSRKESASDQEFDEAKAQLAKAQAAVTRAQSQITAAQAQVKAAQSKVDQATVMLEKTELRSPIAGVAAYINVQEGIYFTPSFVRTDSESAALQTIPMVVIDSASYEVTVNIPSFERQRIKPGLPVVIVPTGDASSGGGELLASKADQSLEDILETFPVRGQVFSVNPAINPGGRAIQVKIRTTAGAEHIEDGMFVTVWVAADARDDVVVAPLDAFIYRENQPFVFTVDPMDPVARLQRVQLGMQGFVNREIVAGVKPGQRLVTDGRFLISDGTPVKLLDTPIATGGEVR